MPVYETDDLSSILSEATIVRKHEESKKILKIMLANVWNV
jgi:hypothetical protein